MTTTTNATHQQEIERLHRAVEELSTLNELAKTISVLREPKEIMQTIVRRSLRAVGARQGVITLIDENSRDPMHTLVRSMVSTEHTQMHFHQVMLGWMQLYKKPLIVNDPARDDRFKEVSKDIGFRNLLSVPMMVKSRIIGVLSVYDKDRDADASFTEEDARLLSIMAGQSAQVVENARLEEEERKLQAFRHEMALASRIQLELLPQQVPALGGYDLAASSTPAESVGGDYFDFIDAGDGRWALCLGDVSGKGLSAAMLMAHVQATLRATLHGISRPQAVLHRANQLLFKSTSSEKFATLFVSVLDVKSHTLTYGNAGHDPGILLRADDSVEDLPASGLPIGMFEEMDYASSELALRPDDVLVVHTDGIAEAPNTDGEQFGRHRIIDTMRSSRRSSADQIRQAILDAVTAFTAQAPLFDDRTLMVVKRCGRE